MIDTDHDRDIYIYISMHDQEYYHHCSGVWSEYINDSNVDMSTPLKSNMTMEKSNHERVDASPIRN